ncbi:hypothetical protein [Mycolicibacterium komossense]|uniref:Transposase n=1 Tax=Mycolicibacterium komossense TaxID=1779 RepID=A0ABT3C593_9MYCO|nr:hypothetical protein [Mycolicibacterium komossense]MCV7224620.1 hypothetical protein [Mycolicibacterium komossense]
MSVAPATGLRAGRYGEVLLLRQHADAFIADVYNSYGLNDCPQAQWSALDATRIAAENQALIAVLNGPRYWLMDSIAQQNAGDVPREIRTFGGIAMFKAATVEIADPQPQLGGYAPHAVNRRTVFTFDAGSEVYELVDPDGTHWVMQSWSQQVDLTLVETDLAGLGTRLRPPPGWHYLVTSLSSALDVDTRNVDAAVLQDELLNSYSRRTG